LTLEQDLARFLAQAVFTLGGHMTISKELLDSLPPIRLVWDTTSEPGYITVAVISNDVIELVVEKADDGNTEPLLDGPLQ
jgi:hypothetical protein